MKHKQIFDLLKTLDIPVAYDHFDSNKNINPPFIVYRETNVDTFKADNKTFFRDYNYELELVTEYKDVALQERLETLLIKLGTKKEAVFSDINSFYELINVFNAKSIEEKQKKEKNLNKDNKNQ